MAGPCTTSPLRSENVLLCQGARDARIAVLVGERRPLSGPDRWVQVSDRTDGHLAATPEDHERDLVEYPPFQRALREVLKRTDRMPPGFHAVRDVLRMVGAKRLAGGHMTSEEAPERDDAEARVGKRLAGPTPQDPMAAGVLREVPPAHLLTRTDRAGHRAPGSRRCGEVTCTRCAGKPEGRYGCMTRRDPPTQ